MSLKKSHCNHLVNITYIVLTLWNYYFFNKNILCQATLILLLILYQDNCITYF